MINTNINSEDPEAIGESLRQQWNALHHLLGLNQLPGIEGLYDQNAQPAIDTRVARAIVNLVERTRGGIADRARLEELLRDELGRERATTTPSTLENSIARTKEQIGVAVAEAYLKVIYRHIEKRDVEQLLRELPAAIRSTDGTNRWIVTGVSGFPAPTIRNVEIDLSHPAWRLGTQIQIQQNLADKTPAHVGVTVNPPLPAGAILTPAIIRQIFLSQRDVIDSNLPVAHVTYENQPAAGQRIIVDVSGILREFPNVATRNHTQLLNWFNADITRYNRFIRGETILNGDPVILNPAQRLFAVTNLHAQMGRVPTQGIASARLSLSDAIRIRQPLDTLIQSTADNRELLLALAAVQRDPTSLSAMIPDNTAIQQAELNRNIVTSSASIEAHQVVTLPNGVSPASTLNEIEALITELGTPIAGNINALIVHGTAFQAIEAVDRATLQMHNQTALPTWEADRDTRNQIIQSNKDQMDAYTLALTRYSERQAAATRAFALFTEPPPKDPAVAPTSLVPVPAATAKPAPPTPTAFTPLTIAGNFACTVHSMDELRAKLTEFHSLVRDLQSAQREIENRGASILELYNFLIQRNINVAANAPQLNALIRPVPAPPAFRRNIIAANTNWSAIIAEARAAIPSGLKTADEYTAEITEFRNNNKPLEGSDACWAIVRRSLENQGMRPQKAEDTLGYIKSQVEHTEESARSVEDLARNVYPFEGDNEVRNGRLWNRAGEAARVWQEDKSYRRFSTFGLTRYSPDLQRYKRDLFNERGIGITMAQAENPLNRSMPLGRLIDAYFRTKYLMELPEKDPRRLPSDSREMVVLMRNLHAAILERAQLSVSGATTTTQEQLAQMGITKGMSKTERLQAAQSYLLTQKASYITANKETLDKIVNRAFAPIKRRVDGHKNAKTFWSNRGKNLKGEGSVLNPLTTVAKTGKFLRWILNVEI